MCVVVFAVHFILSIDKEMAKHPPLACTTPFDQPLSISVDENSTRSQAIIEEAFVISPHLRHQDDQTNVVNQTLTNALVHNVQNISLASSTTTTTSSNTATTTITTSTTSTTASSTSGQQLIQKSVSTSSSVGSGRLKPYVGFDLFYKELESARNSDLISEDVYQSLVHSSD